MNEEEVYSLKELIILNAGQNRLMYFELVETNNNDEIKIIEPDIEDKSEKYAQKSESKKAKIVVEIRFQIV